MAQKAEITIWSQKEGWVLYSTRPFGPKYGGYGVSYLSAWLETPYQVERDSKPILVWTLPEPVQFRKSSRWLHWKFGSAEYWGPIKEHLAEQLMLEVVRGFLGPALERKLRFSPRWLLFQELGKGNMSLEWVSLSLLRPRLRIDPGESGLRIQFFLGQKPWPEGVRPLELALERFPELWLYLA
jgi:hypothetical protein